MFKSINKSIALVVVVCMSVLVLTSCGKFGKNDPQPAAPQETSDPAGTEEPVIQEGRVSRVEKRGNCGRDVKWEYGDEDILAVYGTGSMDNYEGDDENSAPWADLEIKKVYIHEGVTSVGDFAFYMMESVSEVAISSTVSKIGYDAFDGTTWLSGQNEQFVIVGDGVLIKYNGVSPDVTIPYGVKYISNAFYEYGESGVNITSVKMPDSVVEIGSHAFYSCRALKNVVFSSAVESIGESAFENSGIRTNIALPANVHTIEKRAFAMCKEMYSIELSNALENIGDFAFADSGLNKFTLSANVRNIGKNPFLNCSEISHILVSEENINFEADEIGMLYTEDKKEIVACPDGIVYESIIIPKTVKTLRGYAFSGCDLLVDVSIHSSVDKIDESTFDSSVIIKAAGNTAAHKFAQKNGYTYEKISNTLWDAEGKNVSKN